MRETEIKTLSLEISYSRNSVKDLLAWPFIKHSSEKQSFQCDALGRLSKIFLWSFFFGKKVEKNFSRKFYFLFEIFQRKSELSPREKNFLHMTGWPFWPLRTIEFEIFTWAIFCGQIGIFSWGRILSQWWEKKNAGGALLAFEIMTSKRDIGTLCSHPRRLKTHRFISQDQEDWWNFLS